MLSLMPRSRAIAFTLLIFSIVLFGLILTDTWPNLRGPAPETSEWYWPHLVRPVIRWWPAALSAILIIVFTVWWLRRKKNQEILPLLLLGLLSLALQLTLLYADRPNIGAELVDRTLSKATNGYLATAGEIDDLGGALRQFPALMPTFDNDHARTHPPGFIIAHWLSDHLLRGFPDLAIFLARPATIWRCTDLWILARSPSVAGSLFVWSWIPVMMAALIGLPAYFLARRWYPLHAARLSAILASILPALLIFSPTPDQMFAFLSLLSLFFLVTGLQHNRRGLVLLSGMVASIMTFLSLGNAAWLALLGAYAGLWVVWPDGTTEISYWRRIDRWVMLWLFVAGSFSFWLIYWIGWNVTPWAIAQAGLQQHYELVTSLRRYDWWFGYNLLDFLIFAGPPVVAGFVWRVIMAWRNRRDGVPDEGRLAGLLLLLLVAIHFSGSTRGEVGRLWLVFMPLAAILAGGVWRRVKDELATPILVVSAQIILIVAIGFGWRPFYAVILPVERPEFVSAALPEVRADITFPTPDGRALTLIGWDIPENFSGTDGRVSFTLYWETNGPTLRPYTVFIHLVDENGHLVAQSDNWPVGGQWPMTCWTEGEMIVDVHNLDIQPGIQMDGINMLVGLYDSQTGVRLLIHTGDDALNLSNESTK
jgi:hypothetical protein